MRRPLFYLHRPTALLAWQMERPYQVTPLFIPLYIFFPKISILLLLFHYNSAINWSLLLDGVLHLDLLFASPALEIRNFLDWTCVPPYARVWKHLCCGYWSILFVLFIWLLFDAVSHGTISFSVRGNSTPPPELCLIWIVKLMLSISWLFSCKQYDVIVHWKLCTK